MDEIGEICSKVLALLKEAVKRNLSEGILLSGGLDTSILAVLASRLVSLKAFTIGFDGAPAPDIKYASLLSSKLHLKHIVYRFDEHELQEAVKRVVEVEKSFDPMEVRNSVVIYVGLKVAKEHGISSVMTGDGCDELFAGYSFLFNLGEEELNSALRKLWNTMHFSSIDLAGALGLEIKLPFLDPEVKSFAMSLSSKYKVRRERGKVYGKWILRKSFEGILPDEILWRDKVPIEGGSGTATLPELFDRRISDIEFENKRREYLEKDGVLIRSKEQLFYYEIYRSVVGIPHPIDLNGKICPYCRSNVAAEATYCRTCGAYPI